MGMMAAAASALGAFRSAASVLGLSTQHRDAARHDLTELSGWRPRLKYPGNTRDMGWDTITGRARDLDENNGWVNAGLDRRVESVIGGRIRLSAQPKHELLGRDFQWRMTWTADVQARNDVWANDIERRCDARQILSFGALAKLAYLGYTRDGEACAEIRDNFRGLSNPTNVLLIEPERIETPPGFKFLEGPRLRDGIEYDGNGAPVSYHVRNRHRDDARSGFEGEDYSNIPARGPTGRAKFVHVFSPRRAEQNRGVSKLAEVMLPAKMLDRVDRAEVNAALKSALFSIFIKSPGTTDDIEAALGGPASEQQGIDPWVDAYLAMREQNPVFVDGAQVTHLLPDEDVVTPDRSSPNSNYADFADFILRKVAGSLGVATPQLSGDWSGINYSSARALLNEMWRSFLEDRHFFTQAFLTPIYAAWLEWEVANGDVKVPGGPVNFYKSKTAICMAEWIGPGRGSVDPLKEANADNLDVAAGRKSTVEAILERGRDPSDVMAEEDWYLKEREKRGLPAPNYNVKSDSAASEDSAGGGTEDDKDGDGVPQEAKRKKEAAQ